MLIKEAIAKAEKWRKQIDEIGDTEIYLITQPETVKQFLDLALWALKKESEKK